MSDEKTPVQPDEPQIAAVFSQIVGELADVMDSLRHQDAVDIELTFESATVDQSGIPLFTKHSTQSDLKIRLATRLTPRLPPKE